jgi:molybdopterin synthase catalytic subunit
MITVRYFAAAREFAGTESEELSLPESEVSVTALMKLIGERHPRLSGYVEHMRFAVDDAFLMNDGAIHDGDAVDVIPPVAGGSGHLVDVRDEPLSVDEVLEAVKHASAGGVSLFVGVVRDHADGKAVERLDYEAHPTMAKSEMLRVLEQVEADFPGSRLAAVHRVGKLVVGDLAIVLAASAPHRAQAIEACHAAIDRIKESVPVWKKEWAPDGSANWVNLEQG